MPALEVDALSQDSDTVFCAFVLEAKTWNMERENTLRRQFITQILLAH